MMRYEVIVQVVDHEVALAWSPVHLTDFLDEDDALEYAAAIEVLATIEDPRARLDATT